MHDTPAAVDVSALVRRIRSLAHRHVRDQRGEFWIDGARPVLSAADAGARLRLVVECEALNRMSATQKCLRHLARAGIPRVRVSPEVFRQIHTTRQASGVGAIVAQPYAPLRQLRAADGLCWLAAESVRMHGNLGTILRTAEAVGAAGLICVGPSVDPFDPMSVRPTMGGLFALRFARTGTQGLTRWAATHDARIIGLDERAPCRYDQLPLDKPVILFIGDERHGLSDQARRACHQFAAIPMCGRGDSLNVAIATGVILCDLQRRRSPDPRQSACAANPIPVAESTIR